MEPVGYLLNTTRGLEGEPGEFFDYITAGNGIFIHASNDHFDARIMIADADIRGLALMEESVMLLHGKIPWYVHDLAYSLFLTDVGKERYAAITWHDGYHLVIPEQKRETGRVTFAPVPAAVMDIHSHGKIAAFFSGVDNKDEQGLRLYMVVGKLNKILPEEELRIGVYGYYAPLEKKEVFGV